MGDEDDRRYVLCFVDDGAVEACRGLRRAEASMEAPDVDSWRVYDDELFIRDLKVDLARHVSIGDCSGAAASPGEALGRMRELLRVRRPGEQWTDVPFDGLFEAVEEVNRMDDAATARRARTLGLLIAVAVATLVAWRVARWLTWR